MGKLLQDLRYGARMIRNKPAFAAAAVLVLALGIGANTAVFSLVNAFLLKPLLIEKPEEIVGCYSRNIQKPDDYRAFSYPLYTDLRESNPVFSSLAAHNMALVGLAEGETTRRIMADVVSSNYFHTLGVQIFRGRTFTAAEEKPGSAIPVVIVSYSYWKKNGSDPDLVGKTVRVNSQVLTIVGILPEGFSGTTALISPSLYLPLGMYQSVINDFDGPRRSLADAENRNLILIGRLRGGLTLQAADSKLAVIAPRLEKDQTFIVRPLSRINISTNPASDNPLVGLSVLFLSMTAVVLLIASLNVANMMLARSAARRKEIAIRLAIGGSRGSILRQLFTENMMLATLGGLAGLVVAYWTTGALVHSLAGIAPVDVVFNAGPDPRVLAATMGFCLLSTLLFGLAPAFDLSKADLLSSIKSGENQETSTGKSWRVLSRRNLLVMSQISLSLALLTAAGLFIRSSQQAANVAPGFHIDHGLLAEVDASLAGYNEARSRETYQTLLQRLRSIPGVESASLAATVPFGMVSLGRSLQRASDPPPAPGSTVKSALVSASFNIVSSDYFQTLGIQILRGRSFLKNETGGDKQSGVVILDKVAAAQLWPNGEAVGQRIRLVSENKKKNSELEVVGVAATVQDSVYGAGQRPHVYVPFGHDFQSDMNIHLRVAAQGVDAEGRLLETVRHEIRAVDSRLPVLALKTLRDHLDASFDLWSTRMAARMFAIFGSVALLLAMTGLYGVRAYTVARRTREIGIRMALGAAAGDTLRLILREGLAVTSIGLGAGLLFSLGLGKILAGFLYKVSAADPVVLSAAPILLTVVSLLACYLPARRAAKVDPSIALRYE